MSKYSIDDTLVGNDVEFFLTPLGGTEIVPAWDLIGGTKDFPLEVVGGYISEDGISAEVSTAPASTEDEFVNNLTTIIRSLTEVVVMSGMRLLVAPSVVLPDDLLINPRSTIVGCSEDYDPWGRRISVNNMQSYKGKNFRCSGGHVHISHPILESDKWKRVCAKLFDIYLGVPSVLLDTDINRRSMYGNPGAHRKTAYPDGTQGVEYRVLSNFWADDEVLKRWVYQQSIRVINDLIIRHKTNNVKVDRENSIRDCIITGNADLARGLLDYLPSVMPT